MILRCTRKLLVVIGSPVADPAPARDPEDWYANLLWFDRRKCLLLNHAATFGDLEQQEVLLAKTAGSFVFLPRGRAHRFWARDKSARLLLIAVPGGIEDYFGQINNASGDGERHRVGELYGIRVVPE